MHAHCQFTPDTYAFASTWLPDACPTSHYHPTLRRKILGERARPRLLAEAGHVQLRNAVDLLLRVPIKGRGGFYLLGENLYNSQKEPLRQTHGKEGLLQPAQQRESVLQRQQVTQNRSSGSPRQIKADLKQKAYAFKAQLSGLNFCDDASRCESRRTSLSLI